VLKLVYRHALAYKTYQGEVHKITGGDLSLDLLRGEMYQEKGKKKTKPCNSLPCLNPTFNPTPLPIRIQNCLVLALNLALEDLYFPSVADYLEAVSQNGNYTESELVRSYFENVGCNLPIGVPLVKIIAEGFEYWLQIKLAVTVKDSLLAHTKLNPLRLSMALNVLANNKLVGVLDYLDATDKRLSAHAISIKRCKLNPKHWFLQQPGDDPLYLHKQEHLHLIQELL
jgi:hypothetical protein